MKRQSFTLNATTVDVITRLSSPIKDDTFQEMAHLDTAQTEPLYKQNLKTLSKKTNKQLFYPHLTNINKVRVG